MNNDLKNSEASFVHRIEKDRDNLTKNSTVPEKPRDEAWSIMPNIREGN